MYNLKKPVQKVIFGTYFFLVLLYGIKTHSMVDSFFARYERPVTVLEISDTQNFYTLWQAHYTPGVYILLSLAEKIDFIKKRVQKFNNVVLLHPSEFSTSSLVQLASCEHFDITFVHDCAMLHKNPSIVSAFMTLGDYLIIEVPIDFSKKCIPDEHKDKIIWRETLFSGKERLCFSNAKNSLTKARWYLSASAHAKQPSYTIISTFSEKKLVKGARKKTSEWVPGINLITAIMLNLIYPTNDILRNNIENFKKIEHNDPVVGNMIVQGRELKLIDFADARRNADQEKCLNAAIKLFTWLHRPKDPYAAMKKYSEYVHK